MAVDGQEASRRQLVASKFLPHCRKGLGAPFEGLVFIAGSERPDNFLLDVCLGLESLSSISPAITRNRQTDRSCEATRPPQAVHIIIIL